jgi:hypothetical protein
MAEERWDVPSPKLAAIAAAGNTPLLRDCPGCPHRHPKGERCGYPIDPYSLDPRTCRCSS